MKRLFTLLLVFLWTCHAYGIGPDTTDSLPRVVIVATGGTIAEKTDPDTGAAVPALAGDDLVASIPGIKKIANIEVVEFSNIDSSQMTPELWMRLSKAIQYILNREEVTGVVVTHGTDTMEETCWFIDLTVQSDKPVVFVGAQRNASDPFSDGPLNLYNAILQAASPKAKNLGVTVTMDQYINGARNVRKTHTDNVDTFKSGDAGALGYIDFDEITLFQKPVQRPYIPLPQDLPEVALFTMYAGADGRYIRQAVDAGVKGIVIAGFGLGNVNTSVFEALKYARDNDVAVVISSKCYNGRTYPLYGGNGGSDSLADIGAIFSNGLIPSKARVLLMLALADLSQSNRALDSYF